MSDSVGYRFSCTGKTILCVEKLCIADLCPSCYFLATVKLTQKAVMFVAISWIALAMVVSCMSGMVLCIAEGGHFSFESAHEGRCSSDAGPAGHAQHAVSQILAGAAADCCGDCLDVALSSEKVMRPAGPRTDVLWVKETLSRLATASLGAQPTLQTGQGSLPAWGRMLLRAPPWFSAQRTIVLRT